MAAVQQDQVGHVVVTLPLTNSTDSAIKVGLPSLIEASHQQGATTSASTIEGKNAQILCGGTAVRELAPGAHCQARITLTTNAPGVFKARIGVRGETSQKGETSIATVTANVRRCVWLAVLIALFGTAIGIGIRQWNDKAKPHLLRLEEYYAVASAWEAVSVQAARLGLQWVSSTAGRQIQSLRRRLAGDVADELKNLDARVRHLEAWLSLEDAARPHAENARVKAAAQDLRTALSQPVDPRDDAGASSSIEAKLKAFSSAIADAERETGRKAAGAAEARDVALGAPRVGPENARTVRDAGDLIVALVTAGIVAGSAVELVWWPNVGWGSPVDIVTLLIGSILAQAGTLAVVDSFRNKFAG
jgi:hypothetical protein